MTKGRAKTPEARESQLRARAASGLTRSAAGKAQGAGVKSDAARSLMALHERKLLVEIEDREIRTAERRLALQVRTGRLIDASRAVTWAGRVMTSARLAADAAVARVDLLGLPPDQAAALKAQAVEMSRQFRVSIAGIPELAAPPEPGHQP